jgi:phosphatidyl-myo-inositol alpha-mannosyltransferase
VRIGLVSPYSWSVPGGVNDHIANLAAQLEARGHEARIIAPWGNLMRSNSGPPPQNLVPAGSAVGVKINGSKAYVNLSPRKLRDMDELLRAENLDLLHAHEPCTPAVARAAVIASRVPVVGTFHAAGTGSYWYRTLRKMGGDCIKAICVKIAVSPAAVEFVARYYPEEEYHVIPNGVDTRLYAGARDQPEVPGRILFIGRAEPRKGLIVLLQAFTQLRRRLPGATLRLVGPQWTQVHHEVNKPGTGLTWPMPGIAALGRVSQEAKLREMAAAEVLCVPSVHGESFGIVLAEGLAAGLPIVASDLAGYRAVLKDGALGRLVPLGDPAALADELELVLGDADLRARLATRGIEAAKELDWDRVAERVLETYDIALKRGCLRADTSLPWI